MNKKLLLMFIDIFFIIIELLMIYMTNYETFIILSIIYMIYSFILKKYKIKVEKYNKIDSISIIISVILVAFYIEYKNIYILMFSGIIIILSIYREFY